jgi:hypothetical protein
VRVLPCLPYSVKVAPVKVGVSEGVALFVPSHAADVEVEQEPLLSVGARVKQGQLLLRVGDDLLGGVAEMFVFLEQLRDAEPLEEDCDVADLVVNGKLAEHGLSDSRVFFSGSNWGPKLS